MRRGVLASVVNRRTARGAAILKLHGCPTKDVGRMKRMKRGSLNVLFAGCVALVAASAVVGIWHARDPLPSVSHVHAPPQQDLSNANSTRAPRKVEQLEGMLAQAGCPGWIVLASEGESALQAPVKPAQFEAPDALPPKIVHAEVQKTPTRMAARVPRVRYPAPVRVARLARPPQLTGGAPDDPDDLLDGMPDLLLPPTSKTPSPKEQSSPPNTAEPAPQSPAKKPASPSRAAPAAKTSPKEEGGQAPFAPKTPQNEPVPDRSKSLDDAPTASDYSLLHDTDDLLDDSQRPIASPSAKPAPTPPTLPAPQANPRALPGVPDRLPTVPEEEIPAPHSVSVPANSSPVGNGRGCEFVAESLFPAADTCRQCHEKIYDEWSVSSHAYAMVSPMFHKFEQKLSDLTRGTLGYFCYRCHSPVGTTLGISRAAPLWELPKVAREGITCVACHRVNQRYGKVNGERRIEPGSIFAPVYGSIGGDGVAAAIAQKNHFKVKTSPQDRGPGQNMHVAGVRFDQLSKAEFCVSCHQVAVHPGIKLEVVWEQYRASPARKKGITCQDCHTGRIPGVPSGYEVGPAAQINGKVVNAHRKHANHVFYGPSYSIAHPGIFPLNPKAQRWSMREWLLFDHRAGWGTEAFERRVQTGELRVAFPPAWAEVDDRYDARDIINDNLKKLDAKRSSRSQVLENGSHVDGPFFQSQPRRGEDLRFDYVLINTNEGHNLPTGSLGAQPQMWANVVLTDPRGRRIWESGYTDRWGDLADIHSEDVRHKRIPFDWQLFNLQSMFLITGVKGTDREFFLPVNIDIDQLPLVRPGAQPISVINHPPFIRMENRSLPALGSRRIPYRVPKHLLREPGRYRLSFRMRSRIEPIYFMRFCNSTIEMQRAMNEGILDFHPSSVEFEVR